MLQIKQAILFFFVLFCFILLLIASKVQGGGSTPTHLADELKTAEAGV